MPFAPWNCSVSSAANHDIPPGDALTMSELVELAGGLAHELRNPLSTVMINLKLLSEDLSDVSTPFDDTRRRALRRLDTVRGECERLQALFDDFLNVAGPCRPQRDPVDLNAVVARLAEFLEPLATARGVELVVVPGADRVVGAFDVNLISQALLNLAINAQEAMPDGGRLTIRIRHEGDAAVIEVEDQGVGIPLDMRDRVFRPFFSTKGTGTGLGLSITRRIVLAHGGSIDFASELGHGTTFTVRLPLRESGAP